MSDSDETSATARLANAFETLVVTALRVLLVVVITIAVVELFYLLSVWLRTQLTAIDSMPMLQDGLQRAFGGVLMVILGLELLETLRGYTATHHLRVQVIFLVALIAIGRHIMLLDIGHTDGGRLAGVAALVLALTAGYYVIGLERKNRPGGEDSGPSGPAGP